MPIFSDKEFEQKQKKQKFWQKIIMFIGAGSFLATAMIPLVAGLYESFTEPPSEEVAVDPKAQETDQLKQQEAGFADVLKREPNNPKALQGLVDTRLKLGDLEGAAPPLRQLVAMYPKEPVLKDLLAQVEDKLDQSGAAAPKGEASPTTPPQDAPKTTTP